MSESFEQLRLEFLAETEDTLEELQRDLNLLGEGAQKGPLERELVDRVFRTTHSLKGVSAMFGLAEISAVSHAMESVFDDLREGRLELDEELLDLLFQGVESLHRLLAYACGRARGDSPSEAKAAIEKVENYLELHSRREPTPGASAVASAIVHLAESERAGLEEAARAGKTIAIVEGSFPSQGFEDEFRQLLAVVRDWGYVHGTIPGDKSEREDSFQLHLVASSENDLFGLLKAVGPFGAEVIPCEARDIIQRRPRLAEGESPAGRGIVADRRLEDHVNPLATSKGMLRVPVDRVDRILAELAELMQARLGLEASATELLETSTDRLNKTIFLQFLRRLDRRFRALNGEILGIRMITLTNQFQRLERTLREACRVTGREARLVTSEVGVELDKRIVDALTEPLVHLVRNAVDHGLEDRATREAKGKDPIGTVRVEAYPEGSSTVIEVSDDGAGMDFERIREKAQRLNLFAEGTEPSRSELLEIVFHPGFTVRDRPTQISGRGVGLDAVRDAMAALGGILHVDTASEGTTFRLRIPTTLAITQALRVVAGTQAFFLPLTSVTEVTKVRLSEIERVGESELLPREGMAIPVADLGAILGVGALDRSARTVPAVIIGLAERRLLLLVKALEGRREIVVRSLGDLLPQVPGVSGATELGDGKTVLILDPVGVFDLAAKPLENEGAHS